jgi:hypothetical protein
MCGSAAEVLLRRGVRLVMRVLPVVVVGVAAHVDIGGVM